MTDLSIIICTHNRVAILQETLSCISACTLPSEMSVELVIVANACTDETHALLEHFTRQGNQALMPMRWIIEAHAGKSHALNTAVDSTHSNALCFLDDDQHVEKDFIVALGHALQHHTDFEIICGYRMPAWDGTEAPWVHQTDPYRIPIRPIPEYDQGNQGHEITAQQRQPSGGNICVRRSLLSRMPVVFDTDKGPHGRTHEGGEDHDFIKRAREAGARIYYDPHIRQSHILQHERLTWSYMMRKSYHRSYGNFLLQNAHGPRPYMLRLSGLHLLRAITSIDSKRRFYYWIRFAAVLGELKASLDHSRKSHNTDRERER